MSSVGPGQAANLLGAVALGVHDRMEAAVTGGAASSQTAAAALSALDQFLGRPSVDRLAQVVGLSHSGAVRLVDRLEHDGLVARSAGADARSTAVALTAAGRRAARRLEAARMSALDAAVGTLTARERDQLATLLGKMLVGMMREPGARRWTCRLCDLSACGRPEGRCPVERAARERYGTPPP